MGEADRGEAVGIVGEAKGDGTEAEEGDNFSAFAGDGTIDEAKLFVMTEPAGDHGAGEVASDEEVEGGTDIGAEGDGEEAISEAEEATGGDAEGREWDADELEDDDRGGVSEDTDPSEIFELIEVGLNLLGKSLHR